MTKSSGLVSDNYYLSVARDLREKEKREGRDISPGEAKGIAMTMQGRYGLVPPEQEDNFCTAVARAHQFIKAERPSIDGLAWATFKLDNLMGKSPMQDEGLFPPDLKPQS